MPFTSFTRSFRTTTPENASQIFLSKLVIVKHLKNPNQPTDGAVDIFWLNILYNKFKHKVEIVKNYSEDLPKIEAYGRQLNQVFMNILDNAIYAIKEKGTITISSYVNPDKETVSIEIEDTGVGIKEEDIKKVFDPFWTTKPVGQGTGLGMSIAYKVIASHHGYADVSSKLNVGTKFRIVLPINQNKGKEDEV